MRQDGDGCRLETEPIAKMSDATSVTGPFSRLRQLRTSDGLLLRLQASKGSGRASHGSSPAAWIRSDVVRVDDPVVGARELDTFPCHGIEVEADDQPADHRSPNVPVSAGRHRGQSLDGLHSIYFGNSNR